MTPEAKRSFLLFVLGCPHLPPGGLNALTPPLEVRHQCRGDGPGIVSSSQRGIDSRADVSLDEWAEAGTRGLVVLHGMSSLRRRPIAACRWWHGMSPFHVYTSECKTAYINVLICCVVAESLTK